MPDANDRIAPVAIGRVPWHHYCPSCDVRLQPEPQRHAYRCPICRVSVPTVDLLEGAEASQTGLLADDDPGPCGRLLVGQGTDTWDPVCDLNAGHQGSCSPCR